MVYSIFKEADCLGHMLLCEKKVMNCEMSTILKLKGISL